jgi:hypothetical protein
MADDEVTKILAFISECWAGKPLGKVARGVWGAELAGHDYGAVMAVLRTMVRTHKFRPALAEILAPLRRSEEDSATAAFAHVWNEINSRPRQVTAAEEETVRRLGGWDVIGLWRLDEVHFHRQRFVETYRDVAEAVESNRIRVLANKSPLPIGGGS